MSTFKFTMRAAPQDPTGYFVTKWSQAEELTVFAGTRDEAMGKAAKVLGDNNRRWPWVFRFVNIEEVAEQGAAQ